MVNFQVTKTENTKGETILFVSAFVNGQLKKHICVSTGEELAKFLIEYE